MIEASRLTGCIDRFSQLRIAVVGDMMLDVYVWGDAQRLSPEAPVPVVEVRRMTSCLGGAGNVIRNVVTLGSQALAFGMVGDDEAGRRLRGELTRLGMDSGGIMTDSGRRTTEKQRILAGSQQMLRLDHEDVRPASPEIRAGICRQLLELLQAHAVDAVIFEDYRKGLLSSGMLEQIVPEARRNHILTALDPKPDSVIPVPGLSVIKPNRQEAARMAGQIAGKNGNSMTLDETAEILMEHWKPDYLLISLAQDGMALYRETGKMIRIPTRAREVFDVSGAGDTVVATFTLALAAGASPEEAAELSNFAAGIVVGKIGTAPISAEELRQGIYQEKKS